MNEKNTRRLALRLSVKLMMLFSALVCLGVLFASLPERDREGNPPSLVETRFDVSDIQPGEYQQVEWNNKPLLIVHRKPEWEVTLQQADVARYRDPESRDSTQPQQMRNALRSVESQWFVTLGLGTGMGCTLQFIAPGSDGVDTDGKAVEGGFIDACDRSYYDLAGRVYKDQSAVKNTVVPAWRLENGEIVVSDP